MSMTYAISHPVMAKAESGREFQVAEIDAEVEIYGIRGEWFIGEIRIYDLDRSTMVAVSSADKGIGRAIWQRLRTDETLRSKIDTEWTAHVIANGEDGILDAAELQFRHNYDSHHSRIPGHQAGQGHSGDAGRADAHPMRGNHAGCCAPHAGRGE